MLKKNSLIRLSGTFAIISLLAIPVTGCADMPLPPPFSSSTTQQPDSAPAIAPSILNPTPPGLPQTTVSIAPAPLKTEPTGTVPLTITTPEDNIVTDADIIKITGVTSANAVVSVNDEIAIADEQGNFELTITLAEGPNMIDVLASDDAGDVAQATLIVTYLKGGG